MRQSNKSSVKKKRRTNREDRQMKVDEITKNLTEKQFSHRCNTVFGQK